MVPLFPCPLLPATWGTPAAAAAASAATAAFAAASAAAPAAAATAAGHGISGSELFVLA